MHLKNWIPYKLIFEPDQALCRWLHIGDIPFSEPFFDDTILKCKSLSRQTLHVAGNIELLPDWSKQIDAVAPTAFIFHISRCGSTLLSQLLGINPEHIVLSEVPFFDEILRAPFKKHSQAQFQQEDKLQAAVQFYGQQRNGKEQRLFIKADSWHVFFYPMLRKLYPDVPFILLYRKPEEVIRSQQKKRGMQAVPGVIEPEVFGFKKEPVTDLDAYMARVIERYLELFLEISEKDERSLLVNYNDGMMKVMEQMADFTGIDISDDYAQMETRCRYNAKYPDQVFQEQQSAEELPEYIKKCAELYGELEERKGTRVFRIF
ncbi:MAG: sulfotransferase [Chitinophagaceae bacterium]